MTTERGTGIYKEVNLPPFEAVGDWREFSLPSDAPLVNENIREFGSGFYYRSNSPWTSFLRKLWNWKTASLRCMTFPVLFRT
jgi:hypothetical protein